MRKIEVEMHAFAGGAIRTVTLPGCEHGRMGRGQILRDGICDECYSEMVTLGRIFEMGQNDFASDEDLAQGLPSVSVGDIIRLDGARYVVAPVGFIEVDSEYRPPAGDGGFYAYSLKEAPHA